MMATRLCILWQGRKASSGGPVKKHGVYERCLPETAMQRALTMVKQIGRSRKGGAALVQQVNGSKYTLMTCFGKRCKVTRLGEKFGLKSSRKSASLKGSPETDKKFERAKRAAVKAIRAVAEGHGSMDVAIRKMDRMDSAIEWGNEQHLDAIRAVRMTFSPAVDAGYEARQKARNAEIARLNAEIREQRRKDWRNY